MTPMRDGMAEEIHTFDGVLVPATQHDRMGDGIFADGHPGSERSRPVLARTGPEWTLFDLVRHLGTGQRWWAAIVAAGPAEAPPAKDAAEAPRELEALLAW